MTLGAILLGSVTATIHGSGFLAVYLAGLLLSDRWAVKLDAVTAPASGRCAPACLFGERAGGAQSTTADSFAESVDSASGK